MEEKLRHMFSQAQRTITEAQSLEDLNRIKIYYLGKKGELTRILRGMGTLPAEVRPSFGQLANKIREEIEANLENQINVLKNKVKQERLAAEKIDVTLPGNVFYLGHRHPIAIVLQQIEDIFLSLGFSIAEGPDIELDYYNFEALNIPPEHPVRDLQDSFFITPTVLLRTHTSPVQVRTMEATAPNIPVKIVAPGKVYRRDDDATHTPMFHQIEGLAIDRQITFADLKGTLQIFASEMFGDNIKTRFRPSFFPFTEPSAEMDISCVICAGQGCRVCSQTGWLEILGCGMVHPRVLEMSGYNAEKVTGFAFGLGVERVTMLKYGIDDMRLLFDNDLRFLTQF